MLRSLLPQEVQISEFLPISEFFQNSEIWLSEQLTHHTYPSTSSGGSSGGTASSKLVLDCFRSFHNRLIWS